MAPAMVLGYGLGPGVYLNFEQLQDAGGSQI